MFQVILAIIVHKQIYVHWLDDNNNRFPREMQSYFIHPQHDFICEQTNELCLLPNVELICQLPNHSDLRKWGYSAAKNS